MNLISRAMFATPISFCFCFSRSIQSVLWKLGLLIFEQNKKIEWGFHHFYQHNCWSVCTSNLDAVKLYINLKMAVQLLLKFSFYQTRVRSLFTLVSNSLTHWLTHSCLVNLIDMILACKDANSKLVDIVTIAEEDRVGINFCRFRSPGKMWSWMAIFFLLMFCRSYEVESLSIVWS